MFPLMRCYAVAPTSQFAVALQVEYDIVPAHRGQTLGARTTAATSDAVRVEEAQVVWDRITARFVAAGFPAALRMTPERCLQSLPRPFPQPPECRGRLDQALLVETHLLWTTQVDLLGMAMSFDGPDNPYWPADEIGASPYDLIAMAIADPQLLIDGRFFDAVGYLVRPLVVACYDFDANLVRTPGMYHWRGKAEIGANMHPVAFATFRPLVLGDRIEIGLRARSVAAG